MRRRKVYTMISAKLEALATMQLLAELRRLQKCETTLESSDRELGGPAEVGVIEFKYTAEWVEAYHQLKQTLA